MWMNFCACSAIALHDLGMRHAGRVDGDAGGAVEEPIAVDVLDHRAFAARDHERIVAGVGRRHELRVALDDRLGLRAGQRRLDVGCVHAVVPLPSHSIISIHLTHLHCCTTGTDYFLFHLVVAPVSSSRMPRASRSCGCDRLRRNCGRGGRRGAPRSAARSPRPAPAAARLPSRRSDRTPRTRSKRSNGVAHGGRIGHAQLAGVDRRVQRAHEVEQHAERRGGVQVVGDVLVEGTPRLVQPRARPPGWRRARAARRGARGSRSAA